MSSYIIGSGISGLVAAIYNPEYQLFSANLGGQFSDNFVWGSRYLYKTAEVTAFLDKIDWKKRETKIIKVGYFYKDKLHNKLTNEMIKKYAIKTRRENVDKIMSDAKAEFEVYNIDFNEFVNFLIDKVKDRIIKESVTSIDIKNKLINDKYKYDKLISTISLEKLLSLFKNVDIFKYKGIETKAADILYIKSEVIYGDVFSNTEFDYIYFISDEYKFYRITRSNGFRIYEFLEDIPFYEIKQNLMPEHKYLSLKIQHLGKILNNLNLNKIEDIILIGRYSQWQNNLKIQDIIKRCASL